MTLPPGDSTSVTACSVVLIPGGAEGILRSALVSPRDPTNSSDPLEYRLDGVGSFSFWRRDRRIAFSKGMPPVRGRPNDRVE